MPAHRCFDPPDVERVELPAMSPRNPSDQHELGLRRGTVRLVEHRDNWGWAFQELAKELAQVIGPLAAAIEHVGSTAVRELPAKPILDIAIGIRPEDRVPLLNRLRAGGYVDPGDKGAQGGYLFVVTAPRDPEFRLAHIHVVEIESNQWQSYLRFRDLLRSDPDLRKQYAELKARLANQFAADRGAYTSAKEDFISAVLSGR